MRTLLLLVILLALPTARAGAAPADSSQVRAWQTGFTGDDKFEHASLSLTAGLMIGVATREPAAALGGAMVLGLGKELRDRRHTFFDPRDLVADLVGASAAALLTRALMR